MHLTGARIPDPVIRKLSTPSDIVHHLKEKPKPKKLAEALMGRPDVVTIPNIQFFDRRHTPIDKEKEVGRWKLIEEELQKKGLPVTGKI